MPVNLLERQVPTVGPIYLKNPDGSPLLDENKQRCFARVHSPASKVWEVAHAALRRKTAKRVREANGRIEAAVDDADDKVDYLVTITEEFVGVVVPLPEGETGTKAMVRAILGNPALGYIRDQIEAASTDWGSFIEGSATA
ncbi:hypothetical protein [Novosphingobium kaempferiae]|uniref:hypothetical protein n=1 Tax=Novosphingobium kaempferiae TaxID=2896849 RepID=UPI001E4A35D4|nr:hypothetical protein [Novosphingobium kaempferiae]